ncbi:MAG: sugar O-acyltransferase (sialic acid O-acetyltransferase NeuD family) [Psychromonas sp.]|jgi:sugar O-acyltransferase (sialic acid O-acetyltransferase NeuD family)|uniref:NeuD/PglB/VioB family sugar acetyltransferase n=1 Tax=Psychromonas sp. TaxID=1884585 RepID=UPI0039E70155
MSKTLTKLILIGGGGHCHASIDVIESEKKYSITGILDVAEKIGTSVLGYKILGSDTDIAKYAQQGYHFLITIGHTTNANLRKKIYNEILLCGGTLALVISPRAYIAKSSSVGNGCIVMHDVLINSNARIDENCIINSKALVEHDCHVKAHCHISTASVLNGNTIVGEGVFFGSNAVSKQGVEIAPQSFIRANSCYVSSKRKKIAFLTTLFPTELDYINDFFASLASQTLQNFDVVALNDGYSEFNKIKEKYPTLNIIELLPAGNIAKNRQALIQFSKLNNYDIAIFGDIDDVFSRDRVEKSVKALKNVDIVVNDITSIQAGKVIDKFIYSHRLCDKQLIPLEFIKDKNVFGLSNTAVNLKNIPFELIQFPNELIAVDWYFFTLLLLNGAKAQFIVDTVTFYRQHDENTIGIGALTKEKIELILRVKKTHYKNLQEISPEFAPLLNDIYLLQHIISDEAQLNKLLEHNHNEIKFPLWWELTDWNR